MLPENLAHQGPIVKVWSVVDSDNFECGGIHSLHWSRAGAVEEARKLVGEEDEICMKETGERMKLVGRTTWEWTHRTICVEIAKVLP